jgi:nicotinamidase-related amidase
LSVEVDMLIDKDDAALLVVDIQARLAPAVQDAERIMARTRLLLEAASRLAIPVVLSEQYPRGLGHTDERLGSLPPQAKVLDKTSFSCVREPRLREHLDRLGRGQMVVCGMETHVCVLQTALDLRQSGRDVFVVADAVGSRTESSRRLGLERMRDRGVDIVDSEMVVFEWLERAATDDFRALSKLIK